MKTNVRIALDLFARIQRVALATNNLDIAQTAYTHIELIMRREEALKEMSEREPTLNDIAGGAFKTNSHEDFIDRVKSNARYKQRRKSADGHTIH